MNHRIIESSDIAVVGAGIVGLAVAYQLARQGKTIRVFERDERAVGAAVRNFGLIWPIGQPAGRLLHRALRSRAIWLELAPKAGFGVNQNGSLHLAYRADEQQVIEEFLAQNREGYACRWLSPGRCWRKVRRCGRRACGAGCSALPSSP